MNPAMAKFAIVVASVLMAVIRAPYGRRSRNIKVVMSAKGWLETGLLTLAWIGFLVPLVWVATPVLAFADHPLRPDFFAAGTLCLALGLWLFYRAHADLGGNWSVTLEVRENHTLVTQGIYHYSRHPMYLALLVYGLGQALVVPNGIAGPSYLIPIALIVLFRLGPEEQMMADAFGEDYLTYMAHTRRLVPGIW